MNRLLFFSAGFSLIFAVSCSSSSNDNNTQTRIINIPTYKVEDRNAQDCRKLFSDAKRVSLKSTDKNTTLANIGSIKFERDHLYVLDDITRNSSNTTNSESYSNTKSSRTRTWRIFRHRRFLYR